MVEKIDYEGLRAAVRQQYLDFPTNGDRVLEFERRAADLIAHMAVFFVQEAEQGTPADLLLEGAAALLSIPVENIILNDSVDRERSAAFVVERFLGYALSQKDVTPDSVMVNRVEVGDA